MRELGIHEIDLIGGGISDDAAYGGSLASAAFFAGCLMVPGIGTAVALTAWGASLASSALAIHYASR